MKTTMKLLNRFCTDQSGAAAAEYVLILAIIGAALAIAAVLLGDTIANAMDETSTCISSNGNDC